MPYLELSIGLCCWYTGNSAVIVIRLVLVSGSPSCWGHAQLLFLPSWQLCFQVHWAMIGIVVERGFLVVLAVSSKWTCLEGHAPSKNCSGESFLVSSSSGLWVSLVCGHFTPVSAFMFIWPSLLSVSSLLSPIKTLVTGFRVHAHDPECSHLDP